MKLKTILNILCHFGASGLLILYLRHLSGDATDNICFQEGAKDQHEDAEDVLRHVHRHDVVASDE